MKKQLLPWLGFLVLMLMSCTSTYKFDSEKYVDVPMKKGKIYSIATSEDGFYGSDVYNGSGRIVSSIIKLELQQYAGEITIYKNKITIDDFSATELSGIEYIVVPEILHWEDRATAWSGLPDKIEIQISTYDPNKNMLNSTVISGKSASMTLGSTDPSELIEEPVKTYLKTLF